jgi:hypothetical protein
MTVKRRRIIIRSCFVIVWIGALATIFLLDRGHTVFVDNKASPEGSPTSYEALEFVKVSLDGGVGVEFFKGDRDRFPVTGAKHRIRVEFTDGRKPIEREFSLPLVTDLFLLSVPKMIAGIDPFIGPFHMEIATSRTADEAPTEVSNPAAVGGVLAPEGTVVPGSEALAPVAP